MRLAYITSHPIQYQAPLFRALAARLRASNSGAANSGAANSSSESSGNGDDAFKAFFAWDFGVEARPDPNFAHAVKWDVELLSGYDHEFVKNLARDPGTHHFLGLVNPTIATRLRAFAPDVVIVHGYAHATELIAIATAAMLGVPVLIRGDSNLLGHRPGWVRLSKSLGAAVLRRGLAGALAIGTHNREYWRYYGVAEERIFFSPYCVDNAFFQDAETQARERAKVWRQELGIGPETLVVGYAGKLYDVKDLRTLVEAFGRANVPDTALVLVGDGPLRGALTAQAARFPDANIKITGFINQSEMPSAYALMDLFAMTSTSDAWGLSVNEAMCLGLPIVVSDGVGCAIDLVKPDNGWVFPARDVAALTQIFKTVLGSDGAAHAELKRRGEASRARIAEWGVERACETTLEAARVVAR